MNASQHGRLGEGVSSQELLRFFFEETPSPRSSSLRFHLALSRKGRGHINERRLGFTAAMTQSNRIALA